MTVDKLRFNLGNTNYDVPTKEYVDDLVSNGNINIPNAVNYSDIPIGTIIAYMGTTAPTDYLTCDGKTYNISDYQLLADFINTQFGSYNKFRGNGTTTFAVPDLRGEFLRGTGTNSHSNQGDGSGVGIHQDSTELPKFRTDSAGSIVWPHNTNISNYDKQRTVTGENWRSRDGSNQNNIYGYVTLRPTNTSVLYCIKYTTSVLSTPENNYSTTEQRIGTWIDGKPLYQKTLDIGNLPNNTIKEIVLNIPIKYIIKMSGFAIANNDSGYMHEIPRVRVDNLDQQCGVVYDGYSSKKLRIFTNVDLSTMHGYITIQYTKTTD